MTLKPIVLPQITMTLKRAWKANRGNLEKAGIFDFLCWVQSATRVAYVEKVTQFLQTYNPDTETAQVDNKTIRLLCADCGDALEATPGWTEVGGDASIEQETIRRSV